MTVFGLELDETDIGGNRIQRVHDLAALLGGKQPVAGEGDEAEARLGAGESIGEHPAVIGGEIEIVHGAGDVEIGVGVEAVDEAQALMAQIALHLKIGIEAEGDLVAILEIAAELVVQRIVGHVGDVRGHARHGEPFARAPALVEIAALAPVGIGHHRLAADLVKGDVLRGVARGAGDRHRREHAVLIGCRPFQHLHAAHRAAEHREHVGNAEMIEQAGLRPHHVGDGDDGKVEPVRAPGGGIDGARPGRAHAPADDIGAQHEIAIGVDRLAGPDHGVPPAGLAGDGMDVGDVLIAGQRMAHQHEVGLGGIEFAIGLIGDGKRRKLGPAIERQRLVRREVHDLALRVGDLRQPQGMVGEGLRRRSLAHSSFA